MGLPSDTAASVPTGDDLLGRTVTTLEGCRWITAEINYQVDLFGRQLSGKGDYREERSGPIPKVRMDLKIPLGGDRMGTMVQVCDGRYLWTYRRLFDEKLTRVDMRRLAQALDSGSDRTVVSPLTCTIGMGGVAGLLRELRNHFAFEVVGQADLRGQRVWVLHGRWLPERLAAVMPDRKDAILRGDKVELGKLPGHLPERVLLFLGVEHLFPYRIEYRRPAAGRDEDSFQPLNTSDRPGVTMEFLWVSMNVPIRESDFEYRPGDIEVSDATESFLKRIEAETKRGAERVGP
ncbi:MAG: hypothetical protein GX621_13270 [Pirellulaceae bacterium]|nr:hypothetical protein [Pirellulaceae bacterium]